MATLYEVDGRGIVQFLKVTRARAERHWKVWSPRKGTIWDEIPTEKVSYTIAAVILLFYAWIWWTTGALPVWDY